MIQPHRGVLTVGFVFALALMFYDFKVPLLIRRQQITEHGHEPSDSYVSYNAEQMLQYLKQKTSMTSTCRDIYWCVSTYGFFVPRAPQIEARIAQGIWHPRIFQEESQRQQSKNKNRNKIAIPVVIDIGVNDGSDIPIWLQVFMKPGMNTHLFLFEPLETFTKDITKIVQTNASPQQQSRIHFYQAAVGREHGETVTFVGDSVGARIVTGDVAAAKVGNESIREVRQVTLIGSIRDSLPSENNNNFWIPFLKIDCEGYDPDILLNSEYLFEKKLVEVLVFELNQFTRHGVDLSLKYKAAWRMLRRHGYRLFLHAIDPHLQLTRHEHQFVLVEVDDLDSWPIYLEIMVAVKESSVGNIFPPFARRNDPRMLQRYFRSLKRTETVKTMWGKKMYDETTLGLVEEYKRLSKLCAIRNATCFRSVHVIPCRECGWVRNWVFAKSWEVDVLHWRLQPKKPVETKKPNETGTAD
eukprot:PhF_6_TR32203/c0_g2_i1/m.47870